MELANKINAYVCEKCGKKTVTVNACDGVTPFMIECRANNVGCGGLARSSLYRNSQDLRPGWEWYRPGFKALATMSQETQDHVNAGGLVLRKLDASGAERYGFKTRRG